MERRVIASGEPTRRGQRTQHARTLFVREPRDLVAGRRNSALPVRVGKGSNPKPTMNGDEKSDRAIVAVKPANKTGKPGAERVERRAGAKGNANDPHGGRARDRETSRLGIERVRKAAQERKGEKFTTLLHHIDATLLGQAYHWLKRDAAPGVDGMTWDAYGEGLDARLCDLKPASTGVPTEHSLRYVPTSRNRTDGNVRSVSPRWKTRSSSARGWRF